MIYDSGKHYLFIHNDECYKLKYVSWDSFIFMNLLTGDFFTEQSLAGSSGQIAITQAIKKGYGVFSVGSFQDLVELLGTGENNLFNLTMLENAFDAGWHAGGNAVIKGDTRDYVRSFAWAKFKLYHNIPDEPAEPDEREEGFYIVAELSLLDVKFAAQWQDGNWYCPGKAEPYDGTLHVYSRIEI